MSNPIKVTKVYIKNRHKMNCNNLYKDLMICFLENKLLKSKKIAELHRKMINNRQQILLLIL
jgi:hypothetical protein